MSVKEKEALKEITLYKAAATIESVVKQYGYSPEEIIKLEGNENRMGCSPKVAEAVAKEKPVYFLRCTKNDTAAETIRRQIEEDES